MRLFEKREAYAAVKVRGSGVTKPTAMADLVYNGQEQYLVTKGACAYGTLQYSVNGGAFSETRPKAKNAGTYTVKYRAMSSTGEQLSEGTITTVIAKRKLYLSANDKGSKTGANLKDLTYVSLGLVEADKADLGIRIHTDADKSKAGAYGIRITTDAGSAAAANYETEAFDGTNADIYYYIEKGNISGSKRVVIEKGEQKEPGLVESGGTLLASATVKNEPADISGLEPRAMEYRSADNETGRNLVR